MERLRFRLDALQARGLVAMLRYSADLRTLAFMGVTTALLVAQWTRGAFSPLLFGAAMMMAISVSTMVHNHNHMRMWRWKPLNILTDYWLTLFYGFPPFAWIPTHNANHHRFNNRTEDYTATWRLTEKNNVFMLLAYPTVSGYFQQGPVMAYLRETWRTNRRRALYYVSQWAVLIAYLAVAFLIDWRKALLYIFLPQQFSLFTVLIFNYLQHVHADEESEWNHSRNFTSPLLNGFLFNNGLHTAHHWKAGRHWSTTPALHREVVAKVDPVLNERSMLWYLLRTYLLAPVIPRFRSHSMRLDRMAAAEGAADQSAA